MSASIKDTLKKKVNQAQNKAILNKYGTPDVVATIKGKKVEYGNQTDNKKTQNKNRPKKSAIQTLSSTKKAQTIQQQKAKSKLGTDKKGYTITDSNKVMQNYAKKTGSYDVNKYKKDTFDKQREQKEKAKKIVNNIKKGDTLNTVTKKAGKAAKNTGKFLTDFDYRNKVGEKAIMGTGTALSQFSKGALKTVENWGDAARSATDDFNNWVAYKTGIIDKKEYERQKDITRKSIAADAVGDFWKNNLGWNEENAQTLKDYSYVTEDNLLGQLSYGLGQQAPALMLGNTQAVQNLITNPSLQSVAGDGAVKNIARGFIRNAPMNLEIGARSYGGAVEEALQNGATMEQARRYGLLNAGTEIATEWMTGGIPGVENTTGLFDKGVDAVIDKTTGKLTKETSKAIAKSLLSYGFDALGEGLEEVVSEIFSPLIKNMTYSNGEKIDWQNVLNAGIMGMLQGGILNAPSTVANARSDIRQARQTDRVNQEAARQQAEQQTRQELNTAAQSRLNEVYQQQDQTPIFNQQNRMMELAQQQVQAIQQQVQSGQISPQDGIQQIQDIQRYIQSQEAQTEQQQAPVVEQENTPTINETTQDNINAQEEQNITQNANNEVEEKPKNVGKHYGDLGKAHDTNYFAMNGSRRGTGHFGTGTYFVSGDYEVGPDSTYAKRPINYSNFDDYNLARPATDQDGFDLHDALKQINYNNSPINEELYNKLLPYYEASFGTTNDLLSDESIDNYKNIRNLLEQAGVETEEFNGDSYSRYERDLEDKITDVLNNYDRFGKAEKDLKRILGVSDEQFNNAIEKVRQVKNEYNNYNDDQKLTADSLSTIFMKELGYEGVDVRHLKGLNDTEFGSVIYDLKNNKDRTNQEEKINNKNIEKNNIAETKTEPVVKVDLTGEKGKEYFMENGADEKVAQILSEKPKQKTNKSEIAKEAAGQAYRLLVSKGGEIERISKITNRPDVKYKYDKAMRAMSEAQQHIGSEQTDLNYKPYKNFTNANGEKVSMSLNDIRKDAKKNNIPEQTLNEYLAHNLNVDRYMEDKPVFGKNVTSDDSLKRIAEIEQEHPEIKRIAQNVWAYEHNELKNAYDAGLIDEEFYNDLAKNEHYVRIQRNVDKKGSNAAILGRDGKVSVNQGIQTAKGGNQDILPIMEGIAKYTTEMVRNERINESVKSLAESMSMGSQDDTIQSIEDEESFGFNPEVFKANDDGTYTMTFFDKGKATVVPINKAIYDAYVTNKNISAAENALPTRFLTYLPKKASSMFRTLTTDKNPMFMVTNFFKDIGDAPFNSKYAKEFAKEFATTNAHRQVITNGGYNKLYNRAGGDSDSYFTEGEFKDKSQSKIGKTKDKLLFPIEKGNQIIEAGPRMAEFIATIKANGYEVNSDGEMILKDSKKANGRSAESVLDEALYNAAEVTTNFKRGGDLSKAINRNGGTFFNASIQGFDKQVRNFKDAFTDGDKKKIIGLLLKALIFGVAPTMLNDGMNSDDEEYQNMQDYLKDNYYLFKGKDGNYIRIPKGRAMSVIGSAYRRTKDFASGDKDAYKGYAKFASGQVAPNNPFENNIVAPFFAVKNNKSWSGNKIVPQSMEKRPAEEQYNEKTDEFSKWLGGKLKVSPMKINYLIDQYTGGIGDVALPMMTPKATSKTSNPLVQPFISKFTTDSVYQQKSVGDFYDAMSAAETKKYSVKATKEDKVKYSYLYSQNQKMAELKKEQSKIQASKDLSQSEKYDQAREIQKEINKLADESVKNSNNIKDHKYYATIGDNTYYLTTDSDGNDVWAKDGYADSHKASADKKGVALYDYYKEKYKKRKAKEK